MLKWAEVNELNINTAKTKELVFHRPNPRKYIAPDNIPGIDRVTCAKLLGVWLQNDLGSRKHCDYILKICNQRRSLLNLLKKLGLPQLQLQTVFHAILISRLLYAAPAWRGFARAADIDCIQCMLVKAKRWQLVAQDYKFMDMLNDCDIALYKAACNTNHCLNHLFKPKQRFHDMIL